MASPYQDTSEWGQRDTSVIEIDAVRSSLKPIKFPDAAVTIAAAAEKYRELTVETHGVKAVHDARIEVRNVRIEIEETRKALKADSLKYGRAVDEEAKRLTGLIKPIESDLQAKEDVIINEQKRIKAEEDRKAQEAIDELIFQRTMKLANIGAPMPSNMRGMTDTEFDAFLSTETEKHNARQLEAAKLAAERAEQQRLADIERARQAAECAEQQRLANEAAEKLRAEREAFEREQRKQREIADQARREAEEKLAAERAEFAKQQEEVRAEQQRIADELAAKQREAERIERERLKAEAEERERVAQVERDRIEAARIESLRPTIERIQAFARDIEAFPVPEITEDLTARLHDVIRQAANQVREIASTL